MTSAKLAELPLRRTFADPHELREYTAALKHRTYQHYPGGYPYIVDHTVVVQHNVCERYKRSRESLLPGALDTTRVVTHVTPPLAPSGTGVWRSGARHVARTPIHRISPQYDRWGNKASLPIAIDDHS
jgi:hypothetical protein